MDIYEAIRALHEERKRLDQLIASLESLERRQGSEFVPTPAKRRGRRSMSPQERLQVSERMRRYWAERRRTTDKHARR